MILTVKRPALPAGGWGYLEEEAGDEFELAPPLGPGRAASPEASRFGERTAGPMKGPGAIVTRFPGRAPGFPVLTREKRASPFELTR